MSVQSGFQLDPFYMAGTEGTGEYEVVAVSDVGRVGFRELQGGKTRVRFEPSHEARPLLDDFFLPERGWKQPDSWQYRYSTVVLSDQRVDTVNQALNALRRVSWQSGVEVCYAPSTAPAVASRRRRAVLLAASVLTVAAAAVIVWLRRLPSLRK